MIPHVLGVIVVEVISAVVHVLVRDLASGLAPSRRGKPSARPAPEPVIVGAGEMFDRAALYGVWAKAHGLTPVARRGAEYAGTYHARATEMNTGLYGTPLPRSPEILVRVALPGIASSALVERGGEAPAHPTLGVLAALLEVEGVRDVGVTACFVRLRFDAFVETAAFDRAMGALEEALGALLPAAPSPYR